MSHIIKTEDFEKGTPIDFRQKSLKDWRFWKLCWFFVLIIKNEDSENGIPLLISVKNHQKMKILKRVPTTYWFSWKIIKKRKVWKEYFYWFLSKLIKKEDFAKSAIDFCHKLFKKKKKILIHYFTAMCLAITWKCIFLTLERKPGKFFLQKKDGGGSVFSYPG